MSPAYLLLAAGLVLALGAAVLASSDRAMRVLGSRPGLALGGVALLGALGGALAPGAPTGLGPLDAVLRAGFALCFTLLASRARRWAWVAAAVVAVVGSYGEAWAVLALGALGLGLGHLLAGTGTATTGARPATKGTGGAGTAPHHPGAASGRVLGALIGASLAWVLLRLSTSPTFGASAALAGLALVVVVIGGVGQTYRWLGRGSVALGLLAVVAATLAAVATLSARAPAESGLADAQAGLAAAQSGHSAVALADLRASQTELARAHRDIAVWWARPGDLVPVVSQNERAVGELTLQGTGILGAAAALVDASAGGGAHDTPGVLDLARISALGPPVDAAATSARSAQSALARLDSPWLVAPLARRVSELVTKVDTLVTDTTELAQAVQVLPGMLGAGGHQSYLVMLQDPAELRGAGGIVGDQAVLHADHGRLSLSDFSQIRQPPPGTLLHLDPLTLRWAASEAFNIRSYTMDDTFSPDFPTDAALFEQTNLALGRPPVDGVISVDPAVMAALLEITGPLRVPSWPVPLSASNIEPILLHDQYLRYYGATRQAFLAQAVSAVFRTFTHERMPSPLALAHALAPPVRSKQLLAYSNQPRVEASLQALGVGGEMPAVKGDFLEVVTQNAATDKIDWFLRRSFRYQLSYDPSTGRADATLTVKLTNGAPSAGETPFVIGGEVGSKLPPGVSAALVTVYTPLSLMANPARGGQLPLLSSLFVKGRHAYSGYVRINPGSSTTVVLHLAGTLETRGHYQLDFADQPAVAPDQVSLGIAPTPGWRASAASGTDHHGLDWTGPTQADHRMSVTFSQTS